MKEIKLYEKLNNSFAENKDIAKKIREDELMPIMAKGEKIIINFEKIDSATQSFIHALISDVIRKNGISSIDKMYFRNCNEIVQKIITIVINYMQKKD